MTSPDVLSYGLAIQPHDRPTKLDRVERCRVLLIAVRSRGRNTRSQGNASSNSNYISLELACQMLIKFDGNKQKLFEFIDNCDKATKLIKPELRTILFSIIETKLTDNARALVRNRNLTDWVHLKQHLLDVYSEKRTMGQLQLELNSCKQNPSESVMSYSSKVENCYIKLINTLDSNLSRESRESCIKLLKEQALSVFLTGLQPNLSFLVKLQRPESLEKAIATAFQGEQELKSKIEISKYQNTHNASVRHCDYCNKPGHTSFNCRHKANNQRNQFSSVKHIQNPNPQGFRNTNNFPTKICAYCKKTGHLISECRKRQYNNKRQNQSNSFQNGTPKLPKF
ncbi:uncharacterized protein LOC123315964 [Coccinella septempunctata]|uniref:uncharacterized protein LOC123315964 n=1 Tax=Coccinella septempunctata TaxID=41139 RepID=UPI001D062B86|nr:uncharacterized protein LOC123315964 [Coccinella septempunctata]